MERNSGILLHPTSLPGKYGIGTLGEEAREFVDWLSECGQKIWQILPLGAVADNNSPYQCYSAFAGNHMLIDLEELVGMNLLETADIRKVPSFSAKETEFEKVELFKEPLLQKAFHRFRETGGFGSDDYHHFWNEHQWWLESWSLFYACRKNAEGKDWSYWEDALVKREEGALHLYYRTYRDDVEYQRFLQFIFFRQWFALKEYANHKSVKIMGDIPLYVSYDSSDVWANQDIFILDQHKRPSLVGGVPPDYFSETGQLWGNPLFDWDKLKARDYDWWVARVHFNLKMFDLVRIDHFRGLESFWAIPAAAETAVDGCWLTAHGDSVLGILKDQLGDLPIVAEDLGSIDERVHHLRKKYGLPGMKVLQFAFESNATNEHLPHNYENDFVVYPGTHDNNTTVGWWSSLTREEKRSVKSYFDRSWEKINWKFIRLAHSSVASMSIIPLQDIIGSGESSRMNIPGVVNGNWKWRFSKKDLRRKDLKKLSELTMLYGRG
jgi:4-alpha-glucanotransferase